MLYAERDDSGRIIRLAREPTLNCSEQVSLDDQELQTFLGYRHDTIAAIDLLRASDPELARVTEDLVALLVDKKLILWTELPEAAQLKLIARSNVRAAIQSDPSFMLNEDEVL